MLARIMNLPSQIAKAVAGDRAAVIEDVLEEAEASSTKFAVRKVGCLGNHVGGYAPSTTAELKQLLNSLDAKEESRAGYSPLEYCIGTNYFSSAGQRAEQHRKLALIPMLAKPQELAEIAKTVTREVLDCDKVGPVKNKIEWIVRNTFFRGLFKIGEMPAELNDLISDIQQYFFTQSGTFTPFLFKLDSRFRASTKRFEKFSTRFASQHADAVSKAFSEYPELKDPSYILTSVIDEIILDNPVLAKDKNARDEHLRTMKMPQIQQYLQRSFVKTSVAILIAADNLTNVTTNYLYAVIKDDLGEVENMADKWMAGLQTIAPMLLRYTKTGLAVENKGQASIKIPPKTMLTIMLPKMDSDRKEENFSQLATFFSAGKRACPGVFAAREVFESIVTTIEQEYISTTDVEGVKFTRI